jgi:hypothetical protein
MVQPKATNWQTALIQNAYIMMPATIHTKINDAALIEDNRSNPTFCEQKRHMGATARANRKACDGGASENRRTTPDVTRGSSWQK